MLVQGATVSDIFDESNNKTYKFTGTMASNTSSLQVESFTISLTNCPIGTGVDALSGTCEECSLDTVTLHRNIAPCYNCRDDISGYETTGGVECDGNDDLIVSLDYWVYLDPINATGLGKDLTYYSVLSDCPPGYCCRESSGCNYLNSIKTVWDRKTNTTMTDYGPLCAKNRDASVPLCGACIEGYHEVCVLY